MGEKISVKVGLRRPKREQRTFGPVASEYADGPLVLTVQSLGVRNALNAGSFGRDLARELDENPVTVGDEVVIASPYICEIVSGIAMAQPEPVYSERELIALCVVDEFAILIQEAYLWACYGEKDRESDADPLATPMTKTDSDSSAAP